MDPWDWTVDQVVTNLCHESDLWADWPTARRPDSSRFEQAIRREGVDGATLLNGVDAAVLKEELGVRALSERVAVTYVLEILRNGSVRYNSHRARNNLIEDLRPLKSVPTTPSTAVKRDPSATPVLRTGGPHIRAGEVLVEDRGRKRRRLQFQPHAHGESQAQSQPQPQAQIRGAHLSAQVANPQAYFGPSKVSLNDIFFDRVPAIPRSEGVEDESDSESDHVPTLATTGVTHGNRRFVSRRINHFLQTPTIVISKSRTIRYPYPKRLTHGTRYVTLFTRANGSVTVSRRDAVLIDHDVVEDVENTHEWDYLAEKWKQQAEDHELAPLGESDEDEGIYAGSLWSEIEEERIEREERKQKHRNSVAQDELVDCVEDCIKHLEERWTKDKLPLREQKAWSTWRKAMGRRQHYIEIARLNIAHLDGRIEKIKSDIYHDQWPTLEHVRKQCASLDVTVFDRLDNLWQIQIWSNPVPPFRPSGKPRSRPRKAPIKHSNDEESLTSESEWEESGGFESIDEICRGSPLPHRGRASADKAGIGGSDVRQTADEPFTTSGPDASDKHGRAMSEDSVLGLIGNVPDSSIGQSKYDFIDLTMSSPPADESEVYDESICQTSDDDYGDSPETASEEQISRWKYEKLEEQSDRKRIVMKLLHSLDTTVRRDVEKHFLPLKNYDLRDKVRVALGVIKRRVTTSKLLKDHELKSVLIAARIYVCWEDGSHRHFLSQIPFNILDSALKVSSFKDFYKFVQSIIHVHVDSDEDDPDTPRKKKRQVLQDREALQMRRTAQLRRDEGKEREQKLMLHLESNRLTEMSHDVIINPAKHDDEGFIYVNNHIGPRLKTHQVEGIRFLWREIITVGEGAPQGCLLAHTMGLGKTMQTITLLVTIAEASASSQPDIVNQIPKPLRHSRTLILCPASLISNWLDEFRIWKPQDTDNVGSIFELSASIPRPKRLGELKIWYDLGGILIMGYDFFRSLLTNAASKTTEKTPYTHEEHELLKKYLLRGPNIVVADEAHRLKNKTSGTAIWASQFHTTSRIALTGSPLANNLQDYYAMIDWVAPGYLGDAEEFRHYYQQPIEAGTYADSTKSDQRKSLKKLQVLKADIDPKIHRADISVLQNDLKKKVEFLIKLPLTRLQAIAYSAFVQSLLHQTDPDTSAIHLLDWLSVLTLLCNHPAIFIAKLRERNKEKMIMQRQLETKEEDTASGDINVAKLGLSQTMLQRQEDIFEQEAGDDIEGMRHAHKTAIVKEILVHSKNVGDKVLIFSHWITTLDYLQNSISKFKDPSFSVARLDGQTPMSSRQDMIKGFNSGKYDAFLISTKAGGLGLNITGANRVILMDFSWNPSWEEQAVGRAYRIGQLKPVFVYHLIIGGTFEEKLHQITIFKRQLAARVVDKKNPNRAATKVNEMLFEPIEMEQEDLESFRGMDDIFDKLLDSDVGKSIRVVETTETLHQESDEKLTEEELKEVEDMIRDDRLRKSDPDAWQAIMLQRRPTAGFTPRATAELGPRAAADFGPRATAGFGPRSTAELGPRAITDIAPRPNAEFLEIVRLRNETRDKVFGS